MTFTVTIDLGVILLLAAMVCAAVFILLPGFVGAEYSDAPIVTRVVWPASLPVAVILTIIAFVIHRK